MTAHIDSAAESFRTTSRGGGLVSEDLEKLHDYGESGWEIDHVVAHGEKQKAMLFVVKPRDGLSVGRPRNALPDVMRLLVSSGDLLVGWRGFDGGGCDHVVDVGEELAGDVALEIGRA